MKLDVGKLAEALDPSADLDFDYLGIQTLFDRYLVVDKTGDSPKRIETPQLFWMRVAMGVFAHEEKPEDRIIALYNLYKSRRFCSSTPTLFNSGTLHSQLSSCYLYKVDDTIESIMYRGIAENAFLRNGPVVWVEVGLRFGARAVTLPVRTGKSGSHSFSQNAQRPTLASIKGEAKDPDVPISNPGTVMFWSFSSCARTRVTTVAVPMT